MKMLKGIRCVYLELELYRYNQIGYWKQLILVIFSNIGIESESDNVKLSDTEFHACTMLFLLACLAYCVVASGIERDH